jgi:hypothetical protein
MPGKHTSELNSAFVFQFTIATVAEGYAVRNLLNQRFVKENLPNFRSFKGFEHVTVHL